MTTEDRTRFEVLLEDIQTQVKVIADGHVAIVDRLDRMDARLTGVEGRLDQLEAKLDVSSLDTRRRLERIEVHLGLDGPPQPQPQGRAVRRRKAA